MFFFVGNVLKNTVYPFLLAIVLYVILCIATSHYHLVSLNISYNTRDICIFRNTIIYYTEYVAIQCRSCIYQYRLWWLLQQY